MKQQVIDKFLDIYGGPEQGIKVYFAPGRVNLIGEHTDYNGGHVFPCAITIGTYAAARKRPDGMFRFYSLNYPEAGVLEVPMEKLEYRQEDGWANYSKGVIDTFRKKNYPVRRGLDLFYYGEIPKGLGLGSSASLEVVTGLILRDMMEYTDVSMVDVSLFAQLTENEYIGNRCGIMDPFTSAMGKKGNALLLDTSDLSYIYVPLKLSHERIIITNSRKERVDVEAEYEKRRAECETALRELQQVISIRSLGELTAEVFENVQEMIKDPVRIRRARHAVTENQRTIQAAEALEKGDIREFGQLMNASHLSLKEDYEVSCKELDILVEEAWNIDGVLGSRMMGAGFGGCTVSIVEENAVNEFITKVGENYKERTGLTPEFYVVVTGNGASVL
ncbi:galactokinase [Lachnoclostridium sp. An196]|uniref:galactokinase n=1 Tax=Lachnoclostridium sp. An196 TaxID=1965583 RepID=UPI000B384178|nr:galactokinase [Lachnoclostridium sp. An196]OUP18054.1 galactokinase [Lachnoclostridium sp. An196]